MPAIRDSRFYSDWLKLDRLLNIPGGALCKVCVGLKHVYTVNSDGRRITPKPVTELPERLGSGEQPPNITQCYCSECGLLYRKPYYATTLREAPHSTIEL